MDRLLKIEESLGGLVFDDFEGALTGLEALRQLDRDAEISLLEAKTVVKEQTGAVHLIENPEDRDLSVFGVHTIVGAFVGLLAGPVGLVAGAAAGALVAFGIELNRSGVTDEFVQDVSTALRPGKYAVVADVIEDWATPLYTRIEALGGVVFRRSRTQVSRAQRDLDAAALRAELERLKVERATAESDRLAEIDAGIEDARKKLEDALERDRSRMLSRQRGRDDKIQGLKAKADQSQSEARLRLEARIDAVRRDCQERAAGALFPE